MKITFNIECSPDEARAFLGLPDVAPMQQAFMEELQQKIRAAVESATPEGLMQHWLPAQAQQVEQAQKLFWEQTQRAFTAVTSNAADAMNAFGSAPQKNNRP